MPNIERQKFQTPFWDDSAKSLHPRTVVTYALLACGGKVSLPTLFSVLGRHPHFRERTVYDSEAIMAVLGSHYELFQQYWEYIGPVTQVMRDESAALRARLLEVGTLPER